MNFYVFYILLPTPFQQSTCIDPTNDGNFFLQPTAVLNKGTQLSLYIPNRQPNEGP
jgi:hypothetical protein